MSAHRLPEPACPACTACLDAVLVASDGTGRTAPRPGDLMVCMGCGAYLRFGVGLVLTVIGEDDRAGVMARLRAAVRGLRH